MNSTNLLLIISIEVAVLLLVVCIFLWSRNRALRSLVQQLKDKAKDLFQELKRERAKRSASAEERPAPPEARENNYLSFIEAEIEKTLAHHANLNPSQDITLDLSPGTPLAHRAAALRHAVLLAEKDAFSLTAQGSPDWQGLQVRYDSIFSFCEDFSADGLAEDDNNDELESLRSDLENARKRVSNLEKFKRLYFELEEKWGKSKTEAAQHFENLSSMASELDSSGEMHQVLDEYHAIYNSVDNLIRQGADDQTMIDLSSPARASSAELRQLRAVAADQHRIIEGLQRQLKDANTDEERDYIVSSLQDELNKQLRFAQESETCVQLLEDELNAAHSDLEQIKSRLVQLPELKTEIHSLSRQNDEIQMKFNNALTENKKLHQRLRNAEASPSSDPTEHTKLRKELTEMSARYNELEEKFLDLKLQQ